ncbi:tetratricopeptide repeat-containing sensor histidine kinase [uncultured Aquimarina sp.]|uniref:tetratricopeptide repeat-containing sensor histidine kinase n=1 Tax=uncultured Aquimarina sp. TaxID=575652 RepID=UPI002602DB2F|nr:tetratricopeptide repeat-containing sensor histidine kinase [uncultured Aquimarina sp.]
MKTHKTTFILIALFTCFINKANSQENTCIELNKQIDTITNLDTLLKIYKRTAPKISLYCRMKNYMAQGTVYRRKRELDSSLYYYDKAILLAKKINSEEQLSRGYSKKAYVYLKQGKFDKANVLLKQSRQLLSKYPKSDVWGAYYTAKRDVALKKSDYNLAIKYVDSNIVLGRRINDTSDLSISYHNKGYYYLKLSDYESAAKNLLYSIELKEKTNDLDYISTSYYVLGACYTRWEQYETANRYFQKGILQAKKDDDKDLLMVIYLRLGMSKRKLDKTQEALKIIDSGLDIARKFNSKIQLAEGFSEKGRVYFENLKEYETAQSYFFKAYKYAEESNDNLTLYDCIEDMLTIHFHYKDYKNVEKFLSKLKDVNERIDTKHHSFKLYKYYSDYYEKIGKSKLALEYLKKYHVIKDSISNQQVQTQVANLEKKYDTKKKELKIVTLNKQRDEQKEIAQKAKAQQNLYLAAAGFLLLILGVGFWAFRKLRKQQKELVSINQVKNRLFSIIAHDLRGMIIPFQRSGKILKYHIDKGNHEKTIELSKALEQNSDSLSNMLDNLLNWSLEQMNGYKMNPQTISINEQLSEIISGYKQLASYKKTKIDLKYEEDLWINLDKGAFHVIFRNLIGNALKYTEEGNIRIEFTSEDDMFLCSITDTGVGMSQDQLENLFTLEEKESTIGTQGEKGTGLGLNLVYRFIKMHKGAIQVSSEKRIGTRFDLNFPIMKYQFNEKTERKSLSA